jgi:hypothetical protein
MGFRYYPLKTIFIHKHLHKRRYLCLLLQSSFFLRDDRAGARRQCDIASQPRDYQSIERRGTRRTREVSIQAGVTNGSGTVTNVQFLVNNALLASENSGPFSAVTNNVPAGDYTLSAIAEDNNGLLATNSVGISVITPMTVFLTSPSNSSPNNFQFSYSADVGLNYVVQRSEDLLSWNSLITNTAASNPVIFDDSNATNSVDFYRVGRLPNP